MNRQVLTKSLLSIASATLALSFSANSFAAANIDVDAAKALARQNSCFICHSVDKEKVGPTFTKISAKYRGKPDSEAKLTNHLTKGGMAKFPDGHEEQHKVINTKDMGAIHNLVDWILAQ